MRPPRIKRTRRKSGDLNYYGLDVDMYPHAEAAFRSALARLDRTTQRLYESAGDEEPISVRDIRCIRADVETILSIPFRPVIYVGAEWPQALLDLVPAVASSEKRN
jgi:hypothetical protein